MNHGMHVGVVRRPGHLGSIPVSPVRPGLVAAAVLALALSACSGAAAPSAPVATARSTSPSPTATAGPPASAQSSICEAGHLCLGVLVPGLYHSQVFRPGFAFTVTGAGWENRAQTGGAVQLLSTDHPGDILGSFRDPRALDESGTKLANVGADVASLASWFAGNASITVSARTPVTVGGLSGTWFDVAIAPGATSNDPECPAAVCRVLLKGSDTQEPAAWAWDWGLAGTEKMRVYLLTTKPGVVAIIADSVDGASFNDLVTRSSDILATVAFD